MAASSALIGRSRTPGVGEAVCGAAKGKAMHNAANNAKDIFMVRTIAHKKPEGFLGRGNSGIDAEYPYLRRSVIFALCQHCPGATCQLVGDRYRHFVAWRSPGTASALRRRQRKVVRDQQARQRLLAPHVHPRGQGGAAKSEVKVVIKKKFSRKQLLAY